MPIIKSAKKRVKVAASARSRNLHTKRQVREALRAFSTALDGGKPAEVNKAHRDFMSAIDTATKKNVIHKNKAAHLKSRLAKRLKEAGIKPAKAPVAKAAVKKATTKKSSSAKTVKKAKAKTASKK